MSAITTADFTLMGLPELIGSIQWEFEKAEKAAETALGHGINCGHALNAAKQKIPHGAWMRWIEDNTSISHSTVNMFMTLASNSQRVENSESIRGALKLLADDKAEVRRRHFSETYIPYDGETAPAPAPRQPPAPVIEAEIVQPSISDEVYGNELEVMVVDGTVEKPTERIKNHIPSDGKSCAIMAIIKLDRILDCDTEFEWAMNHIMTYCQKRMNAEKENPWVTSRQAITELMKLDDKISSPLGDVISYIEKRWHLTFNLKVRKQP